MLFWFLNGCSKGDSKEKSGQSPAAAPQGVSPAAGGEISTRPGPDGTLAVVNPDGSPADGVKLSQYDSHIFNPRIAVGSDGTIHVVYEEQLSISPFTLFVYHRQSTDGGKTWSDPKNLSEDMPGINVGNCKLLVDGKNRTYVIWRTGMNQYAGTALPEAGVAQNNLVFRCLEAGRWSAILRVHKPMSERTQDDGSIGFMAVTDAAGNAQVIFNCLPNQFHPDKAMDSYKLPYPGIKAGLIFQASLDGSAPVQPREIYMAAIKSNPANPAYSPSCDGFTALDGYADADGKPHLLVQMQDLSNANTQLQFVDSGRQITSLTLPPDAGGALASFPPRLLTDAGNKRHIIAKYDAGEHPAIRDYLDGSDTDPSTIMQAQAPPATIMGFQACQGLKGKMAVLVETTRRGYNDEGETFLLTSDGGKWSTPICLTNNAGRAEWMNKRTGQLGGVVTGDRYGPGPGSVAWDKDGNLLVALINYKTGSFGLSAGGVVYTSGSSSAPMLFFIRVPH